LKGVFLIIARSIGSIRLWLGHILCWRFFIFSIANIIKKILEIKMVNLGKMFDPGLTHAKNGAFKKEERQAVRLVSLSTLWVANIELFAWFSET
jgi:hypothetical protein